MIMNEMFVYRVLEVGYAVCSLHLLFPVRAPLPPCPGIISVPTMLDSPQWQEPSYSFSSPPARHLGGTCCRQC